MKFEADCEMKNLYGKVLCSFSEAEYLRYYVFSLGKIIIRE